MLCNDFELYNSEMPDKINTEVRIKKGNLIFYF
jgi:hypothetical protein